MYALIANARAHAQRNAHVQSSTCFTYTTPCKRPTQIRTLAPILETAHPKAHDRTRTEEPQRPCEAANFMRTRVENYVFK